MSDKKIKKQTNKTLIIRVKKEALPTDIKVLSTSLNENVYQLLVITGKLTTTVYHQDQGLENIMTSCTHTRAQQVSFVI